MKTTFYKYSVLVLIIGLLFNIRSSAQETSIDNYRMLFYFKTVKQADNSRMLEAQLIARNKKDRKDKVPVLDAEIQFFNILNDEEVLLGKSKTNKEGIAQITLAENQSYLTDEEGNINLKAYFKGTDAIDEQEETISVKDLHLELDLKEIDSVKTVLVNAFVIDSLGTKQNIEESDIIISVNGMLSKMPIEEGYIEDGKLEFEMPTDIPGDVDGNLTVYAIIEDHDEFGNVMAKKYANWGVFNQQDEVESNSLWTEAAPIWMYIVLTILLVGVWANYAYTILNLFSIKKEGKALEMNSKNQ
ncbi:hypothetical protein E1J38_002680 [Seonamhaeicola sediminis]|uniref:Uncharacterized protein n=1 Tax=Seonamhaeicola sediminis TaxID=2528206 RepID=A0A562YGM0_9FLAO|nr:hypothetical protein [Seonamhaeicola sediminis]TWO33698.1 hypothetical protein E1J38_002680 [Seonamhaeicola sediminis]